MDAVLSRLGLGLLVTLVLGLLALNVLAWSGGLVDEESSRTQESVSTSTEAAPRQRALAHTDARGRGGEPIARERAPRRGAAVSLVLTSSRGDCWVEARAGSSTGETLYAGMLTSGSSLRFNRPRVWLRLGAASNVDIEINGRPSAVPSGTVELLLPDA